MQPYDLAGVKTVLLDVEASRKYNLPEISPNLMAFNVQSMDGSTACPMNTRSSSSQQSSQPCSQQPPQYQPVKGFIHKSYQPNSYRDNIE